MIDIFIKIIEKEREALENVDEEEVDSNTSAMQKAFKTLAENLQREEVRNALLNIDK